MENKIHGSSLINKIDKEIHNSTHRDIKKDVQ
jgi:hypothetical protein